MVQRNFLTSCTYHFALISLSYLLGAAAIFFELPSSPFLRRAFVGGVSWYEHKRITPPPVDLLSPPTMRHTQKPGKTCDGFTLCLYGGYSRARLINMRGELVHEWHVPFSQLWPAPPHLKGRIDDAAVYFNDGHIDPNGNLLAVIEGPINMQNMSHGYGLVKLDKDSRVLWTYAEKCHHDIDVAEDGTIYALVNETLTQVPPELESVPTPCVVDHVDVISANGERMKRIALLEALLNSPYAALFGTLERPKMPGPMTQRSSWQSPLADDKRRRDVLHANAVKVLNPTRASKFPFFKTGQLLVSLRNLDAIVVLDLDSGKVVWAARGPWRAQHDPSFLENGRLLLFDNLGSPKGSRVLEYDPQTQAFPWTYPGDKGTPFHSELRGMCQRLPGGNTLIVNSEGGEVIEATPDQETVWSCSFGHTVLYRARRYIPEQLPFLGSDQHARP
ncbi:MAG TPA: arylsulfotransferase family protein [Gemmataceae bacterium]|jgi:hypothetical protein